MGGFEVAVKLVDQWVAFRDLEFLHFLVGEAVEVLDQGP
jgi:hypothetical protein